jgi:hypothetical protein
VGEQRAQLWSSILATQEICFALRATHHGSGTTVLYPCLLLLSESSRKLEMYR